MAVKTCLDGRSAIAVCADPRKGPRRSRDESRVGRRRARTGARRCPGDGAGGGVHHTGGGRVRPGKIPGLRKVPPGLPIPVSTASGDRGLGRGAEAEAVYDADVRVGDRARGEGAGAGGALERSAAQRAGRRGPGARRFDRARWPRSSIGNSPIRRVAAVTGINPASITNGTTGLVSTGVPTTDVPALIASFYAGRPHAVRPVLLVSPATADALALGKVTPHMPVVVSPPSRRR